MKKDPKIIQMIVLGVFGLGIVIGILFFSGKIPLPGDKDVANGPTGSVLVWGVLPYNKVKPLFDKIQADSKDLRLTYVEKKPETMQNELVNALSAGKGPDIFMMGPGQVAQNIERLYIIPFESYPETTYRNTFADIGDELVTPQGILGLPLFIDPIVMYYNRDILTSNFITKPPTTWDELANLVPTITQKDDAGKIDQSTVALGTSNNTSYTKDMIVLKMLQSGAPIVQFVGGKWNALLESNNNPALSSALDWFVGFSNVSNPTYSWNQSLPKDRDYFTAGNLAVYFGYPTEITTIRQKNPNLNFALALAPQASDSVKKKVNYGRLYTIGISKISKNLPGALGVATIMTNSETMTAMLDGTYYAPARRDLLSDKPRDNAEKVLIYNSAIISKSFFDPDAQETNRLITTAIGQINAGTKNVGASVLSITTGFRDLVSKLALPEAPLK